MTSLTDRVLLNLKERREKVLSGGINCIPSPFKGFRRDFPGPEPAKYYLISGASKSAKTQITNYLFLYTPILYAYNHPDQIRVQIFYFPLEETPESITERFMCYLLYTLSGGKIRVSPMQLGSIDKDNVIDKSILELLNTLEYRSILDFYEEHVHYISERNPTGAYKTINKYALEAGTVHKKTITIENKQTGVKQEKEVFDYYEPKDPDEYVIIIYDHASLIDLERGMNKKECIDKLSEYFIMFRNRYHYTPVLIQQQGSDTISLDALKANRIRPTLNGLKDSKVPGQDCTVMLGITNPSAYEIPMYPSTIGWDITKLRGYARFLEVTLNRAGESNGLLALYFDGATNFFAPLPNPKDTAELNKVYNLVKRNMGSTSK